MDDHVFASYTSSKIRSKHTTFNEGKCSVEPHKRSTLTPCLVGDAMVRELDFSRITLRIIEHLDKKGEGEDDHIIAKLQGSTLDTLRRCLVSLLPVMWSF